MSYGSFTDLNVYKDCRNFRKEVSAIVKKYFPDSEKYLLSSQILDSSRSITANIAEGYGRFYFQDSIRFNRIARGSLNETLDHLITAFDDKYINKEILKDMKEKHDTCLRLINGHIRYLEKSKRGAKATTKPPVTNH